MTLDHVMTVTADALDSGILKFSNGAVIGRAGSSTRRTSVSRSSTSLPVLTSQDLAQVHGRRGVMASR